MRYAARCHASCMHLIVDFPQNQVGLHSVFVYARSAGSGTEGIATTGVNITSSG